MPPVMLDFELNEDDKKQIRNLKKTLHEKYDKNSTKDNLDTLMRNYFERIEIIYSNAHERALKYYEKHQDKILCALKQEVKNYATFLGSLDNSLEKIDKAIDPLETQEQKKSVIIEIKPYLEILKNNAPKDYEEIISFIDYAFEHRAEFFKEAKEAVKNGKKKLMPEIPPKLLNAANFNRERHGLIQSELYKFTLRKKKKKELDPILDILKIKEENFILFISSFSKVKWLRQSALQLLDIIIMDFTEKGAEDTDREIRIPLKEYMEMRGLKDEKEARKQIKEDLEAIYNLKFEKFTQPIHGKKEDFFNLAIIGSHGIENGKIIVSLDGVFSKLLSYYPAIPIHKGLLKLKANKNPCAYYFAKKIHEHKFMNSGKKNEDIIAVMTLLEAAQNVLPSYEEVFNGNRDYNKKIIAPFYRDMEALVDIGMLSEWTYWHQNGIPLTDAEIENLNYEIFKELNVKVTWTEYPDQSNRLEAKNKRIKAAEKKKENRKKKSTDKE